MRNVELARAVEAVRRAAVFCHLIRTEKRISPMTKTDGSPVTNADFGSQALIVRELRAEFPNDPIMAEETATSEDFLAHVDFTNTLLADLNAGETRFTDVDALALAINRESATQPAGEEPKNWRERYWVIDPIDGTKGYLKGGQYAVALGLIERGRVSVAALACPEFQIPGRPETGWILYAMSGKGAFAVPIETTSKTEPVSLCVSSNTSGPNLTMCESLNHSPHGTSARVATKLGVVENKILKMDSQAKYAAVACGSADMYLRLPTSATYREAVWDHAAGVLIVEEAGGKVTDIDGESLSWNDNRTWDENHRFLKGRGVVVTNGPIHAHVLEAISQAGNDEKE